jgi:hypothetical protein
MLQSSGRYATRDRRRCYNLLAALLQAVDAAAGDATISRPLCYKRSTPPPAMLQSPGRSATRDRLRCYKVPPAMLQSPGRSATSGRHRRCYKPPLAMLHSPDHAATSDRRPCYKPLLAAVLLQAATRSFTVVKLAGTGKRRCFDGRPSIRCYKGRAAELPQPSTSCCKG